MEFILITVQHSIKTLIYTMVKNYLSYCTKYYVVLNDRKNAQKHYETLFQQF